MIIVSLKNISFFYRVLNKKHNSLKVLFKDFLKGKISIENYLALDSINFEVKKGQVLAIIGRNGAGKSTLLKILARVMSPSNGELSINGQIAPMIELGAGFNTELTGRENILFYASLLGRDLKDVRMRVEMIAEWAGLKDKLDYQLRTYSTGMVARLAFAVATDQMPDILLIDEVLSVGDEDFAIKSRARMTEMIESECTVIIVSHDLDMVVEMADEVIWLEKGRVLMHGKPAEVITAYKSAGL
jgi:ABC-type polysaccharide/polyol phosphate transport system ATPase subunit